MFGALRCWLISKHNVSHLKTLHFVHNIDDKIEILINGLRCIHRILWKDILRFYQRREVNTTGNVRIHKSNPKLGRTSDYITYNHKINIISDDKPTYTISTTKGT